METLLHHLILSQYGTHWDTHTNTKCDDWHMMAYDSALLYYCTIEYTYTHTGSFFSSSNVQMANNNSLNTDHVHL